MSFSHDVSHSPVTTRSLTPSPPEDYDEHMGLCEQCLEAHDSILEEGGPYWDDLDDQSESPQDTMKSSLPADKWPDLPRLLRSAQAGCEFCAFLREVILSDKFSDAWNFLRGERISRTTPKRLDLDFWYRRPKEVPGHRNLIIRVKLGQDYKVYLYFVGKTLKCKQPYPI